MNTSIMYVRSNLQTEKSPYTHQEHSEQVVKFLQRHPLVIHWA